MKCLPWSSHMIQVCKSYLSIVFVYSRLENQSQMFPSSSYMAINSCFCYLTLHLVQMSCNEILIARNTDKTLEVKELGKCMDLNPQPSVMPVFSSRIITSQFYNTTQNLRRLIAIKQLKNVISLSITYICSILQALQWHHKISFSCLHSVPLELLVTTALYIGVVLLLVWLLWNLQHCLRDDAEEQQP